ncbi:MAG: TIGR01777 family oxidoreductase [Phycisphaerales bacterium]|nr:TIGR01777 family oxidoreductase [Phycisphaerales bacterium]
MPSRTPSSTKPPLRLAVSGSSGFVGTALVAAAHRRGHDVIRLVRRCPSNVGEIQWHPGEPFTPDPRLEGLDAVVHLAGAGVADRRWTRRRKAVLRSSRVDATRFLSDALLQLERPPPAFVQASATGIYGDRGDEVLTEQSSTGTGFLADLATDWEHASGSLTHAGFRVALIRIGMVIGQGGAIARMRPIFRMGLGGHLGRGTQWVSWIALSDLVEVLLRSCCDAALSGPINAVSPNPVTNRAFTKEFARACHRRAFLPAPAPLLRMGMGQMAGALLLASQRCQPAVLAEQGFQPRYATLRSALNCTQDAS